MFGMMNPFGNPVAAAAGAVGGGGDEGGENTKEKQEEEERERLEAIREAEERRKDKHRKMEEEREEMRQGIRDKYGIKKKEIPVEEAPIAFDDNPLNRKKKTPEELAKEAELADADDFTKLKNQLEGHMNTVKAEIEGKCSIQ